MIRRTLATTLLSLATLAASAQAPNTEPLTGTWLVSADFLGTPRIYRLEILQQGSKLTGKFDGQTVEGTLTGSSVHLLGQSKDNDINEIAGTIKDGVLTATDTGTDHTDPTHPLTIPFTATLAKPVTHAAPLRHEFTPTVFYRSFSALNKPVLTISSGDTIHTTTVDAGGTDFKGIRRAAGGNPETGPFYINGAMPGDTLAIHIIHLKLNRDWAISDDNLDESAMNSYLAVKMEDNNSAIRWHLDLDKSLASPEKPGDHMSSFTIPLHPMLGCIATAPNIGQSAPPSQDSGSFGGNMDFNEIAEGATVYLPVSNPGGMLYFGDGHALQGDGELNGNALETSMDVELIVTVIPGKRIGTPRVETPDAIISMGLAGSLDDAFKQATANMSRWLEDDYKLTPSELAQFLGVAADYHVGEVADRNSTVVLRIAKSKLATLTKPASK